MDSLPDGRVVVVHSPPADDPWAPTWALEEELRIGTVDGEGPESFAQVKALVVDGNARMSVFDFERGLVSSSPLVFRSWGFVWEGALREDGHVLMPSVVVDSRRDVIRVLGPDMRQVDSILLPPRPEPAGESPGGFRREGMDGMSGYVSIPFYPQESRPLLPSGELWSASAGDPAYRVPRTAWRGRRRAATPRSSWRRGVRPCRCPLRSAIRPWTRPWRRCGSSACGGWMRRGCRG